MIKASIGRLLSGGCVGRCWTGRLGTAVCGPATSRLFQKKTPPGTARTLASYSDKWTWEEIRIPTPHGSLAAKSWGPIDAKPVLALHGWQDNANSFDLIIPLLEPKYRVIALDFVGHGYSSHLAPGLFYSINHFFLDVQRVVDYYDWSDFTIIGHSMGGGVAQLYSILFPERVRKLVTIDVPLPPTMSTDEFIKITVASTINLLRIEREHFGQRPVTYPASVIIQKHMKAIKNAYTEEALHVLMKRGFTQIEPDQFSFNRDRRLKYIFWNTFDLETVEQLAARYKNELLAIRCLPMIFFRKGYEKLQKVHKENCSSYQYVEVEGLHHIHMTDPEKVAPLINSFLNE